MHRTIGLRLTIVFIAFAIHGDLVEKSRQRKRARLGPSRCPQRSMNSLPRKST